MAGTLLGAMALIVIAFGAGVAVGRQRGPVVGIAVALGVLLVMAIAFVAVLAISLPM